MEGLEKAQLKDRILRELPLLEMNETEFYENLGKPVKSMAHFKAILEEIKNYNSQFIETSFIFSKNSRTVICKTAIASIFLESDSFTAIFEREQAEEIARDRRLAKKHKEEQIRTEKEKIDLKNAKRHSKTFWMPIAISIISLCFAGYALFKPSDNVNEEEYNTKIDSIENELEQLKIDSKEENEVLLERIHILDSLQKVQSKN